MRASSPALQTALAAKAGLIVLNTLLLAALFSQVDPHPPARLGPFLGACLALGTVSWLLLAWRNKAGLATSLLYGLCSLPSVGPHKFVTEAAPGPIAPVIVLGSVLAASLLVSATLMFKRDEFGA